MERTYKKMRVIFADHFSFEPPPKSFLPFVTIFSAPCTICLDHLPIGAHHGVPIAINVAAPKFVSKFQWNLFQQLLWGPLEKVPSLLKDGQLAFSPFGLSRGFNQKTLDLKRLEKT